MLLWAFDLPMMVLLLSMASFKQHKQPANTLVSLQRYYKITWGSSRMTVMITNDTNDSDEKSHSTLCITCSRILPSQPNSLYLFCSIFLPGIGQRMGTGLVWALLCVHRMSLLLSYCKSVSGWGRKSTIDHTSPTCLCPMGTEQRFPTFGGTFSLINL